jgi:hypothetical protein
MVPTYIWNILGSNLVLIAVILTFYLYDFSLKTIRQYVKVEKKMLLNRFYFTGPVIYLANSSRNSFSN